MSQDRFRYDEKIHGPRVIDSKTGRWMSVDLVRDMASAIPSSPDPRDEVISTAILTEARIHAVEHPSKDIRYFAQCVVEELTKREEVIEKCRSVLDFVYRGIQGGHIRCAPYIDFDPNATQLEFKSPSALVEEALAAIKALERGK